MILPRVLHIATSFPSNPSDISGPFIHKLVRAEKKLGLSCAVLTPAGTKPVLWPGDYRVYRYRYAPWSLQRFSSRTGGIPAALDRSPWLIALVPLFLSGMAVCLLRMAGDYDVIHAHWSICGAAAALTRHLHRLPVITTLHGTDHHKGMGGGPYGWLHGRAVSGSRFLAGVSRAIVSETVSRFGLMEDKVFFIPNGVSESFFSVRRSFAPGKKVKFLFAGSLIELKGVDCLLKAFAGTENTENWHLGIVGDGPERTRLEAMAVSLGIGPNVTFSGAIVPDGMPELMAEHDVLVLPSYREGRPSVVLEAMAAAMPVVATDIPGTRELVQNGRTGWLFPPGNETILADILTSILAGEKDLRAAGTAGRKWMVENELTWAETAERYRELYFRAVR